MISVDQGPPQRGTPEYYEETWGDRHAGTLDILTSMAYRHLPVPLAHVSKMFADLAEALVESLDDGPELTVALRKILEGKDAAVRHAVKLRRRAEREPTMIPPASGA